MSNQALNRLNKDLTEVWRDVRDGLLPIERANAVVSELLGAAAKEKDRIRQERASRPNAAPITRGYKKQRASEQYHMVLLWLVQNYPDQKEFDSRGMREALDRHFSIRNWDYDQLRGALAEDGVLFRPAESRKGVILDHQRVQNIIAVRWPMAANG